MFYYEKFRLLVEVYKYNLAGSQTPHTHPPPQVYVALPILLFVAQTTTHTL
jgi:hypothetical protein